MFIDARNLPEDKVVDSDICIVGGGAAGITIAKELRNNSYRVCLLESGGLKPDKLTQSLSDGENIGLPYFPIIKTSHRCLGGNTNLWNSYCIPFDDIDFEHRPWVPYSGWPFTKQELIPFYERAQSVCKLKSLDYYEPRKVVKTIGKSEFKVLSLNENQVVTKMWQFYLPPISFGDAYKTEIECANNIDVYLYANVVDIETNETAKAVKRIRVACINGRKFWVTSKIFILAMGGIEIPRLLLASNKVASNGLGNQHDLVGRFFMEHPHLWGVGKILIASKEHYPFLYTDEAVNHYRTMAGLCPSRKLQEKEKILNYSATFRSSVKFLAKTSIIDEDLKQKVFAIIDDFGYLIDTAFKKLSNRSRPPRLTLDIISRSEQAPNPHSRITLSREKDKLGLNKVRLDWRLTEIDKRTILKSQQAIREELRLAKLGQLKIELSEGDDYWPSSNSKGMPFGGGWHPMGTTRMHVDPKQGVVDKNCRVHGINNLYIASSSVFPTSGFANPTLTIVALAIRLADHINEILK